MSKEDRVPFASHQFGEFLAAFFSGGEVVGGDEAIEMIVASRGETGIPNHNFNAIVMGLLDRADHGFVIQGGESNGIDLLGDEILDDLDLAFAIALDQRPFPDDFDLFFLSGLVGTGVDCFPEQVIGSLWNNGDAEFFVFFVAIATREKGEGCEQE
jgi:hypothetical protein